MTSCDMLSFGSGPVSPYKLFLYSIILNINPPFSLYLLKHLFISIFFEFIYFSIPPHFIMFIISSSGFSFSGLI